MYRFGVFDPSIRRIDLLLNNNEKNKRINKRWIKYHGSSVGYVKEMWSQFVDWIAWHTFFWSKSYYKKQEEKKRSNDLLTWMKINIPLASQGRVPIINTITVIENKVVIKKEIIVDTEINDFNEIRHQITNNSFINEISDENNTKNTINNNSNNNNIFNSIPEDVIIITRNYIDSQNNKIKSKTIQHQIDKTNKFIHTNNYITELNIFDEYVVNTNEMDAFFANDYRLHAITNNIEIAKQKLLIHIIEELQSINITYKESKYCLYSFILFKLFIYLFV